MQVAGTWSDEAAAKVAGVLARLGLRRGFVVHGSDGLGEVTLTGPSTVFSIENGTVSRTNVTPEDFGFSPRAGASIRGGDIQHNRAIAEAVLVGEKGAAREIVLINAALGIVAAGLTSDFLIAVETASESIDSGAALRRLNLLREAVA